MGDFRWLDRKVAETLKGLHERNRFTKGYMLGLAFVPLLYHLFQMTAPAVNPAIVSEDSLPLHLQVCPPSV